MHATIVLLTDFGLADPYVGQMKGVIRCTAPDACVLDLCHEISPHNIAQASFLLQCSNSYFPRNSIFICVVDPGVGTSRAIIAAEYGDQIFLAPDNGLLSFLPQESYWWRLHAPSVVISSTFHGRDIFAPLAARLACGAPMASLASRVTRSDISSMQSIPSRILEDSIICEILHVDRFGNCLLNISENMVDQLGDFWRIEPEYLIRRVKTYAEIGPHEIGILAGSQGVMELAMNQGSCAIQLNVRPGQSLTLTRVEP